MKRFSTILVFLLVIGLMSGCTAPMVETIFPTEKSTSTLVPIPTDTPTLEPTFTPTPEPTPIEIPTPTLTPTLEPQFSKLCQEASIIADTLGWKVMINHDVSENFDSGIFLCDEVNKSYFVGFEGFEIDPNLNPSVTQFGIGHIMLSLIEWKNYSGGNFLTQHVILPIILTQRSFPDPLSLTTNDIIAAEFDGKFANLDELRKQDEYVPIPLKMWPLTKGDLEKILSTPTLLEIMWAVLSY